MTVSTDVVRNFEGLTREPFQEVACDRFPRCKADGMHEAIKLGPGRRQIGEQLLDLLVAAHVTIKNQFRVKVSCKLGDAVLEPFAHITEGQLCALRVARFGNAIGDGTV
jgi:hypothetical protein